MPRVWTHEPSRQRFAVPMHATSYQPPPPQHAVILTVRPRLLRHGITLREVAATAAAQLPRARGDRLDNRLRELARDRSDHHADHVRQLEIRCLPGRLLHEHEPRTRQ